MTHTTTKRWRIAQIGCGAMGDVHAAQISEMPEVKMTLAIDLDKDRAATFGKKYGFERTGARWQDAVDANDVDIVIVATYAETHHEICQALLRAGKHVICEKPYSMKLSEIAEITELAAQTRCKVRIGFILRFSPAMAIIREQLANGAIGPKPWFYRMTMAQAPALTDPAGGWAYFSNLIDQAGSATADCGIHYVDMMRWWSGEEVTHVSSIGITTEDSPTPSGHNLGLLTMNLSGGSAGWVEDNWSRVVRPWQEMELIGPEGRLYFQFSNYRSSWLQREGHCIEVFSKKNYRTETIPVPTTQGKQTAAQLRGLIQQIETDADVSGHLRDVYKCTEVVLAANIAAREKRTVTLPLGVDAK